MKKMPNIGYIRLNEVWRLIIKKSEKPYEVHASTGYRVGIPGASDTLESFMKESDDIMYQNKIENKRRRNEPLR